MRSNTALLESVLVVGVLVVSGCTSGSETDVASLGSNALGASSDDGYLNESTAEYAACLESHDLTVAPVAADAAGREGMEGYAQIAGAANLVVDGGVAVSPDAPIGVDGVDRDAEIRNCYTGNPGAKDTIIDMADSAAGVGKPRAPENPERFEAGVRWAECARDAGVKMVSDPPRGGVYRGFVIIPEGVSLDQARMLGEVCSRPMAIKHMIGNESEFPLFTYEVIGDLAPYADALDGVLVEIGNGCRELDQDECIEKLGW